MLKYMISYLGNKIIFKFVVLSLLLIKISEHD